MFTTSISVGSQSQIYSPEVSRIPKAVLAQKQIALQLVSFAVH